MVAPENLDLVVQVRVLAGQYDRINICSDEGLEGALFMNCDRIGSNS
jgi:hypothetical protein